MTIDQEEALYDFLDNAAGTFALDDVVSYLRRVEPGRPNRLAAETEAYINLRNLAFPAGRQRWISRQGFFAPLAFVISPTRLELLNGILIPGHRCIPFANANLLPQEYTFFWQGFPVPDTTTEGPPEEFYPYYSIFGEEFAPQYIARENDENEEAFNSDPYEDPPEVSVKTLDMRNIYREASFVPGDSFLVRTMDWKAGKFELKKTARGEWSEAELQSWLEAAEAGFELSFNNLGPASCTEEQIAYAYWYGGSRMGEVPAYSLEEFLYEKTDRIDSAAYGIETRFWYAGREIPDRKGLDGGLARPDNTPVEQILRKLKIPVSEYVIHSYVRDSLFRSEEDDSLIMERLVPASVEINSRDRKFLDDYIGSIMDEFRGFYSSFADKAIGPVRSRIAELHTAVVDLCARLCKGEIDPSWLPRHTFIILSQIQNHAAGMMEDMDFDESPSEAELEAMDNSLDSMLETYEDIKELIDEALESFRRNRLAIIRPGSNSPSVAERLIQLSIGGIDVWRRLIVKESLSLGELHQIIQTVFGWRNSQTFRFSTEKKELDPEKRIEDLEVWNITELLYEYGTKWTVRIMILSRHESPINKPVRCVAGAGTAPPEFISGPLRFKRVVSALESGNDMERLSARQELGPEYMPGEFDLDACNRNLIKRRGTEK